MEIEKVFEGLELTEEIKTELTGRLEKFKGDIDTSYTEQLTTADSKLKDAIASRTKAKDRVKELEDKIATGNIDGLKETKELADKYKADFDGLTETHNSMKTEFETNLSQLMEVVKKQKTKILEKIPDNLKPAEELLDKMGLEDLSNYHDGLVKQKVIVDKSSSSASPITNDKSKNLAEWRQKHAM